MTGRLDAVVPALEELKLAASDTEMIALDPAFVSGP
jgi:hypothetical protein